MKTERLCCVARCRTIATHFVDTFGYWIPICSTHASQPIHLGGIQTEIKPYTESEIENPPDISAIVIKPKEFWPDNACKHVQVEVDADLRRVTCAKCQELLDPTQVLIEFSKDLRKTDYRMDAVADYERKEAERKTRERDRRLNRSLSESNMKVVK